MSNPESSVISDIDALIDEQLSGGPVDDYSVNRYDRCRNCGSDWHGLPALGCPGSTEKAERVPTGTVTQDGPLVRQWDANMNYLGTWDNRARTWTAEVGELRQPMTATQRLIQAFVDRFGDLMTLPEVVFDPSAWGHDQAEWAAHMQTVNEELQEMARETAMPRQILMPPGRIVATTDGYSFDAEAVPEVVWFDSGDDGSVWASPDYGDGRRNDWQPVGFIEEIGINRHD